MNMQLLKNYAEVNSTTTSTPSLTEDYKLFSAVHALTKNQICTKRAVRQLASVISNNTAPDNEVTDNMTIRLILILL